MCRLRTLLIITLLSALCVLSGCCRKPTIAAVSKAVNLCSPAGKQWLQKMANRAHGQYVQYGQQVLFELPTREVFIGESRNYTKRGREMMTLAAKRFACFTTQSVLVTVYTGTLPSPRANVVLAKQRAKVVGRILRDQGVERLISENGKLTSEPSTACGINRVQIKTKQFGSTYVEPPASSCPCPNKS